ncbi:MAG: T9SS type A sorting domain-containing protein [Ignavibacteriales bacterium]|nr:T9SS type A sorting domain-containing protein [Ignavibacteriales bacterium]
MTSYLKTAFLLLFLTDTVLSQIPAFPGAEGSGMYSAGGRGGTVYEVTTLNNSGIGSIVDAVSKPNRTVVFRVSGTILLNGVILKPKSNITIAGQTAPGDGICIKGRMQITSGVSNIIIRYIRIRVDEGAANSSGDGIDIEDGSNIIIDHVTASYSRDEGISCQETTNNITVQWCLISEALTFESHSYGSLIRGTNGQKKTYHHNLYAHNNSRNPRPGNYTATTTDSLGLFFDFRNNVMYNWKGNEPGYNADKTTTSRYNFIGNVCIPGPESNSAGKLFKEDATSAYGYFSGNMFNGTIPVDPYTLVSFNGFTSAQIAAYQSRAYLLPMLPVSTTSPEQAKTDVLLYAGACRPSRDIIDTRIINDVVNKTGHSIFNTAAQPEGGWPTLNSLPAPVDSDHDGMPDAWETAHGLNPTDAADRNNVGTDGYTMLEIYINTLAGNNPLAVSPAWNRVPDRLHLAQNYPNPFNPATNITYKIISPALISLKVYDVLGNEVRILAEGYRSPGVYSVTFDGEALPSGIYIYKLQAGVFQEARKMILLW